MTSSRVECIEFRLVDPRLASANDTAQGIVATIGALFSGSYLYDISPLGNPDERAKALDGRMLYLAHYKNDLAILVRQGVGGIWQFYYCSICGGNLNSIGCMRCKTQYNDAPNNSFIGDVPTLPLCISAYAVTAMNHAFLQQPPLT